MLIYVWSSFLVALDVLALGDVPLRGSLVELALAVRALHVVGVIGRRRRRQVGGLPARRQVALGGLGRAHGRHEFLALLPPVGLLRRSLR